MIPWVEFSPKGLTAWTTLVFIALMSTCGAYFFYYQGLKYLEASRAAITATLEPVVAAAVAFVWWHESFNMLGYIGSVVILAAVAIMVRDSNRMLVDPKNFVVTLELVPGRESFGRNTDILQFFFK